MVAAVAALLLGFGPRGFVVESPVQAFAVSPDGRRVACARDGNWFDIYDAGTGAKLASGRGSDGDQLGVLAFSPDGKTLAGGNPQSATVWLWDAATGEQHLSVTANPTGVWSLAFSPDGKRLACGGTEDGQVRVVDPTTRATVVALGPQEEEGKFVKAVAFHPNGRLLVASVSPRVFDCRVKLWRTGDRPRAVRTCRVSDRQPDLTNGPVAFDPSGRTVFVSTGTGLRAVETATGEPRWETWAGQDLVTHLIADPTGRLVAGQVGKDQFRIWGTDAGELVSSWQSSSRIVARLAAGGDRLFATIEDRAVLTWPWPAVPQSHMTRPTAGDPEALAGADAAAAFAAIRRLSADPAAVALARAKLIPIPPSPVDSARRVRALVRQLAVDDFDDRQAASRDLAALGPVIAPELRRALRATDDPEVTDRLAKLLREFDRADDAAEVTATRWLEVLERVGTQEAVELVRAVAGGDPDHPRTEDAGDTLARLEGRKPGKGGGENRR